MKRFLFLLSVFVMCLCFSPASAYAASSGSCGAHATWTLSDDGVMTISGSGAMADYDYQKLGEDNWAPWYDYYEQIKSVVIGSKITTIGDHAFHGCSNIQSLTFESGSKLKSIGHRAFFECPLLSAVTLPSGVTYIGDMAFGSCSLTSITIPENVTYIGVAALYEDGMSGGTDSMMKDIWFLGDAPEIAGMNLGGTTVHYPEGNASWASLISQEEREGHVTFTPYQKWDVGTTITEGGMKYKITSSKESAYEAACIGTEKAKASTIVIADTLTDALGVKYKVTSINAKAFQKNIKVKNITIGKYVKTIGKNAFNGCKKLTTVTVKGSSLTAKTVGKNAFKGIKSTCTFKVPAKKIKSYTSIFKKAGAGDKIKVKKK